ncbi:hypothetical protein H072_8059 [Dactylellina haptotyla CBS 200.50]|uniref:Transcription factor Iwr1 domain-containing protein n=1 Tax=Dactylellina haptotyla (strain CBS 200.50) TaxID=1284197 RepID=S8AB12_DACHA|nr:hypothetical protein H072_8059 [Dactylellina haptotyla CBS 200.50]
MTLPPHTIRIKRRRNEDPVQTLLVESKRRRVDGEFCFILHDTVDGSTANTPPAIPTPNGSKPGQQPTTTEGRDIPIISTTGATPTREHAAQDSGGGFQPGSYNDVASSDREGRPIAADRQLAITKREIKKAVSPARSVRLKKKPMPVSGAAARHKLSESISSLHGSSSSSGSTPIDPATLSPTTKAEVRRYHLSKKMKIENGAFGQVSGKKRERGLVPVFMEGAGRVAKKRSAMKIGKGGEAGDSYGEDEEDDDEESLDDDMHGTMKANTTKKPKTHFKEKAMLRQQRSGKVQHEATTTADEAANSAAHPTTAKEGLDFGFDSDELARQLQDMVLDYISNQPDLNNYPSVTPKSPVQEKRANRAIDTLGGGVGGGTWADVEKAMDVDMKSAGAPRVDATMKLDSEGEEEEWVYDVYFRQEIKKNQDGSSAVTNGDYGVLVISNSDDEQWWYENDEDEESASDMWGSDDEDSNAEEYYKNDYPDEDDYDLADSDNDTGAIKQHTRPRVRGQKKRGVWDYNSDGSYDLEREDESD